MKDTKKEPWHFAKTAYSSAKGEWDTPKDMIRYLSDYFTFDLDPAASAANVCKKYYTENDNGLIKPWHGLVWLNPPYGRIGKIGLWIARARDHGDKKDCAAVCLVPARVDTKWWQNNISAATQVTFIKGRLKFGGVVNSAPFPSAFIVFGEITPHQRQALANYGWSVYFKQSSFDFK